MFLFAFCKTDHEEQRAWLRRFLARAAKACVEEGQWRFAAKLLQAKRSALGSGENRRRGGAGEGLGVFLWTNPQLTDES